MKRPRLLEELRLRLQESPAVAMLGARQVGKTTLAAQLAANYQDATTFDLERPSHRRALESTPEATLGGLSGLVVLDEVQRIPELFSLLRPLCDASLDAPASQQTRFLLLGSASPNLVRGVSESLAGRVQFISVGGFTLEEVGPDNQDRLWLRGGFPRAYLAPSDAATWRWCEGFRQTYVEQDVPALGFKIASAALLRFWRMLAHFHGQLWNAADLARSMDVSANTANHYRDLLAGTFLLRVLQPWLENVSKRQVKACKVYLRDSGLLHELLGVTDILSLRANPRYGASWEGFALEQILQRFGAQEAYFWATQRGAELDLLLIRGTRRIGFEFKCSDAPTTHKSMHIALSDLHLEHLYVIYPGDLRYGLAEKITALPLRQIAVLDGLFGMAPSVITDRRTL